ncbi:MAG TPA: hypothetical protein VD930_11800 [Gemmatimonadales bacterium]|nr:hypothetical protein [Gemmatimonadales bacterium]
MNAGLRKVNLVSASAVLLLVALTANAEAQVGIRSGVAQVTLLARSAPQSTLPALLPVRETGRSGTIVEAAVNVRWGANTDHRLVIRRAAPAGRIWVQDVNGVYQELSGGAVVVAKDGAGLRELEVRYRIEVLENEKLTGAPPVRYEIAVNPTI